MLVRHPLLYAILETCFHLMSVQQLLLLFFHLQCECYFTLLAVCSIREYLLRNVGQSRVKFQLWDTAGHERLVWFKVVNVIMTCFRFRSMLPMYYRRANAAIIVYDVTSEGSFAQVTEWIDGILTCMATYVNYNFIISRT